MKYNDEELQLLLLNWITNNDFCCPIKKIEASSFDFDQLQPCSSNKLYFLVELQRNKDDNMRRTLGDYKLIQSTVHREGEVVQKNVFWFQKRRANLKGIKLVEFSKVDGSKVCHFTYFFSTLYT